MSAASASINHSDLGRGEAREFATLLVSHFTPSLMAPATLEAILVDRHELANELVQEVLRSASGPTKAQMLLVGPRGIGKTHLATLVYHRVRAQRPESLCIAWLREEEYGVVSWLDLLLRIFRALEEDAPGSTPRDELERMFDLPTQAAEREAQALLEKYLEGRTLWLIVENLDAIFSDLKEAGQRKWRAWMQEHPIVTTLATSPGSFSGVSGRSAPFYGFFRIEPLRALDVDGAALLLQKIARARGDADLARFITTPAGHARVRAVHHLAGGNFRIYVVFSAFLKRDTLDALVTPFMQLLDELTPYYQGQIAALSAQQRKIIEVLCDYRGAMPVKLLASRGFMSHSTATSQLVELRARGYVVSQPVPANSRLDKRESRYELREPLLRLCLQVKKQRGEPVAILIDFLRLWYRRDELSHRLESCAPEAVQERKYLELALRAKDQETEDPVVVACERDWEEAFEKQDWPKALNISEELLAVRGDALDWGIHGDCLHALGQYEEALAAFDRAINLNSDSDAVWADRAQTLISMDRLVEALESVEKAAALRPRAGNFFIKGRILGMMGRDYQALQEFNKSLKLETNPGTLFNKGVAQKRLGHFNAALKTFFSLDRKQYEPRRLWPQLAHTLHNTHDHEAALDYWVRVQEMYPESTRMYSPAAADSALAARRFDLALEFARRAHTAGDNTCCVSMIEATALLAMEHEDEGIAILGPALDRFNGDFDHLQTHTFNLLSTLHFVFDAKPDPDIWTPRFARLSGIFERHSAIAVLSAALTDFAGRIALVAKLEREIDVAPPDRDEVRPQAQRALKWCNSWLGLFRDGVTQQSAPLHFAARLSQAAVEVAASGDEGLLLDLPAEERAIVREILSRNDAAPSELPR